jgi:hypothetical protein
MAGTTYKGIPYPTSSDSIAPLETWLANIANGADNAGIAKGSATFTGPSATGNTMDVEVTYSRIVPMYSKVFAMVEGPLNSSCYAVTILGDPTIGGFTARVLKLNGTTAEELKLVWITSSYTQP